MIVDGSAPVITLAGSNPQVIGVGAGYIEAGASALDDTDGDLSGAIAIDASAVNPAVAGSYPVTYNVSDAVGNAALEVTRTVIVDGTAPVITRLGPDPLKHRLGDAFTDPGVTALDDIDGDLGGAVVVGGAVVDPQVAGTYLVTYNVSDTAGNAAVEVTRTVIVDGTAPVITLIGPAVIKHQLGAAFTDPGATAEDTIDGDLTAQVVVGGDAVDPQVEGSYTITYHVSDAAGNAAVEVTRTVVVDGTAPVITLVGPGVIKHQLGSAFTDPGATAEDTVDGDLTAQVVVGGDAVDPQVEGSYTITYNVSDAVGNAAAEVTRTVVVDGTAPVITLLGPAVLKHQLGAAFTDPGATAEDTIDGDLTAQVVVGGDVVDPQVEGSYTITYHVSDAAGNAATEATRTVIVDGTAPVITLLGPAVLKHQLGAAFTDPGATAEDTVDGDLTAQVVVGGDVVDPQVEGSYTITYHVSDAAGNAATEATRTVIVDGTAPVITLLGKQLIKIKVGEQFFDPWFTAHDDVDGDVCRDVVVGGDLVDSNTPGTYLITYNVSDAVGNVAAETVRTVIVDGGVPTITLLGDPLIKLPVGAPFIDPGVAAEDDIDGDITAAVFVGGDAVDPQVAGTYTITYHVSDEAGNAAAVAARTVIVDGGAPVISLLGPNPLRVVSGGPFIEPGFSAQDNIDGDVTSRVAVGGDVVETGVPGSYTVTYNVSDAAGNAALEVTRSVVVVAVPDPKARLELPPASQDDVRIHFETAPGFTYTLLTTEDLARPLEEWALVESVAGNGLPQVIVHVDGADGPRRFYRLAITLADDGSG